MRQLGAQALVSIRGDVVLDARGQADGLGIQIVVVIVFGLFDKCFIHELNGPRYIKPNRTRLASSHRAMAATNPGRPGSRWCCENRTPPLPATRSSSRPRRSPVTPRDICCLPLLLCLFFPTLQFLLR